MFWITVYFYLCFITSLPAIDGSQYYDGIQLVVIYIALEK